jgi:hypothetical protein
MYNFGQNPVKHGVCLEVRILKWLREEIRTKKQKRQRDAGARGEKLQFYPSDIVPARYLLVNGDFEANLKPRG